MSLKRKSVGDGLGQNRVRQAFKSPFRADPPSSENAPCSPTSHITATGSHTSPLSRQRSTSSGACSTTQGLHPSTLQTPPPPTDLSPSPVTTLGDSTPCRVIIGKSPLSGGSRHRRKVVARRPFSTPLLSPGSTTSPQQAPLATDEQVERLNEREQELDREISGLQDEGYRVEELQGHIDRLHSYNEVKDAAQLVLGRLAELQQVSLKEMHHRYGAPPLE